MQKPTFKKGDVLVCIDNGGVGGYLTVGKEYTAIKESKHNPSLGLESVEINFDNGCAGTCFASRFKLKEQPNPKRHKHADLIHAWAEGAEIEFKNVYGDWAIPNWTPSWSNDTEYRIKLAIPDDIVLTGRVYLGKEDGKPNVQYTFDGTTSELKDVKLLASEDC